MREFSIGLNSNKYQIEKILVRRMQIISIQIIDEQLSIIDGLIDLKKNPWLLNVQLDHKLDLRNTPNDPHLILQWALHNTGQSGGTPDADIDAPEAWDITTGGINPLGDTIVVAIVDVGCQINHPDLLPNLWSNRGEIPDNGVDDDQNGFIDDVHGWNAFDSSGAIPIDNHGTHVSGIIGAKGNNNNQISGVNWSVKLMPVAGSGMETSIVLEAYNYILEQRILYDSTNGAKGAFIVAVNNSFGIDSVDCNSDDFPLWNVMYNAFGEVGILNVVATMNHNADVDITGDVPTSCNSSYLISVTGTTFNDVKDTGAAYGASTVDLGAPGVDILSTVINDGTSYLSGTSMAAPHVTGAIALLHSGMTPWFAEYYKTNPAEGALIIKEVILEGTDIIPALEGITVSGGRLNLYNSLLLESSYFTPDSLDPNPVANVHADTSQPYQITLLWEDPTTLYGGDPISEFVIEISRDGLIVSLVNQNTEQYSDRGLQGDRLYTYTFVIQLASNDSTSYPVSLPVISSGVGCIKGDVNHDGVINDTDVDLLSQFVLEYIIPSETDLCAADIDTDQKISVLDVLLTAEIILIGM